MNDEPRTSMDDASRLALLETTTLTREDADKHYAMKIVERLVFGLVAMFAVAVVNAIIATVAYVMKVVLR